ncbi:hypothetical protein EVJ58_g11192 [Rhodofomes roseus]|nr:hypothetical protein EVJ58_g11192 [Rhodofomes roseus]
MAKVGEQAITLRAIHNVRRQLRVEDPPVNERDNWDGDDEEEGDEHDEGGEHEEGADLEAD